MAPPGNKAKTTDIATREDSTALISVIERAATNPEVDMDKMERLLQMQERIFERQAEIEFNNAMAAVQAEIEPVARDAKNDQTRSKYARLEAISKAINPIISRHGFAVSFGTAACPLDGHYRITCEVTHCAGHSKQYHADVPADLSGMRGQPNKTKVHAFGSTMSYGRRYLTMMIFNLATEDDDDGQAAGGSNSTVSAEQLSALRTLLDEIRQDEEPFLKYYGAPSLAAFPAHRFEDAKRKLRKKAKAKGSD